MTEYYQGKVLDVNENTIGTEVVSDHAIGALTLNVYDPQEFNDTGGALSIEGVVYGYSKKDDDAGTITLTSALTATVSADTEVFIYPISVEKEALVQIDDEDPVFVSVPHTYVGVMEALVRDGNDQESVIVKKENDDYEIDNLLAETYTLYGQYIDTTGMDIPAPVPVDPPAVSPAVRVTGFTSSLVAETDNVEAGTSIQYHISTTSGYTPGPSTLFTDTEATVATIDRLPDGTPLDPAKEYYIRTLAYNVVGTAVGGPSAEVVGRLNLTNVDTLITSMLIASFIQTGKISVGQFTLDSVGMKVNRPGGGYVFNFPFDGVTNLEITAAVTAVSLSVLNALAIQGNGTLYGTLTAANGIVAPSQQPGVNRTWPYNTSVMGDGTSDISEFYHGMIPHPTNSNQLVIALNFLGLCAIRTIDKTTGLYVSDLVLDSWYQTFAPNGGITYNAGSYYLIGTDSSRSGNWYLYKINSTTGAKQGEFWLGDINQFQGAYPRMFVNPAGNAGAGEIFYVFINADLKLRIRGFDPALNVTTTITDLINPVPGRYNMGDAHFGNIDGIGSNRLWVSYRGAGTVMCFNPATWVRDVTYDFTRASTVQGMTYDSVNGQMISYDSTGLMYRYGKYPTDKSIIAKYAWYDANATGGTHETQPGPSKTYTLPARSYLSLQGVEPPDYQNTDPLNTDKANQVAMYATDDGGATWRRMVYTAPDWGTTYGTLSGLTTGVPKVTNEFLSSSVQTPGVFQSTTQNETIDGIPNNIWLDGSGKGRMGRYGTARHFGSRTRTNNLIVPNITEVNIATGTNRETISSLSYDNTNDQFIVAKPGLYLVEVQVPWPSNSSGRREIRLKKNGTLYTTQSVLSAAGAPLSTTITTVIPFAAGDNVSAWAWQNSGGSLTVVPTSDQYYFNLTWIAP